MRLTLIRTIFVLAVILGIGIDIDTTPLAAQQPVIDGAGPSELEALAATLEDDEQRAILLDQLRALITAERKLAPAALQRAGGAGILDQISERVDNVSGQLVTAAATLLDVPAQVSWIQGALGRSDTRATLARAIGVIVLILLMGILAHWIVRSLLSSSRSAVDASVDDGFWLCLTLLLLRTLLDLVPVLAFAGAAYGALALLDPDRMTRVIAVAIINSSFLSLATLVIARLVLAPKVAALRILSIDDETANYAFIWIRRLTYLSILGFFAIDAALSLGLPVASHLVLIKLLGLAIGLLLIMIVVQSREQVSARLRGDGTGAISNIRRRIADIWHILLILYLITFYLVWVFEVAGGFRFAMRATLITIVIVIVARLIAAAANHGIQRGFDLSAEVKARLPGLEARANRYLPWLLAGVRSLVYLLALFAILQAWGIGMYGWLAKSAWQGFLSGAIAILLIVTTALIVWELSNAAIERYFQTKDTDDVDEHARSLRIQTLLPILRNFISAALAVIVAMTILSELGVNIAPLLAGAGVVGLAIGFGAQTLVKDVITGLFFLIEDAITVGDVVNLGSHSGVVEAVTARSVRLRDLSGTVHYVPFSEVMSIINMTKKFSFAVMDIGVAYRENVDEVIDVIKQVGAELRAAPEFEPLIIDDLEVLGLDKFEESAVIIRARIKTQPIMQWAVRRGFNRLLKQRFDTLGIEIPFPHRTVYFGEDKEGRAPAAQVRLDPQELS